MCTYLQSEQCHSIGPLNFLNTSREMFSHSTILKSRFLMWYQTHHILHIQNISTVEIFSGEKRVTVFPSFLRKRFDTIRLLILKKVHSHHFYQF